MATAALTRIAIRQRNIFGLRGFLEAKMARRSAPLQQLRQRQRRNQRQSQRQRLPGPKRRDRPLQGQRLRQLLGAGGTPALRKSKAGGLKTAATNSTASI